MGLPEAFRSAGGASILGSEGMTKSYDVIIVGAGVVGNAIARELSRYQINVAVLEKELDVGRGTSSRNSGVLHSGIHYKPGSVRAKVNVQGNDMMGDLCHDLKVKIQYIGKLTVSIRIKCRRSRQASAESKPFIHLRPVSFVLMA
jgi:monoamine oxidase